MLGWTDQEGGEAVADAYAASLENVSSRASDGAILKGWLFSPQDYHGRAVLLVHAGLGNRRDMLGHAKWLVLGLIVPSIDQRAAAHPADVSHGASTNRRIFPRGPRGCATGHTPVRYSGVGSRVGAPRCCRASH